jgi:predicted secreted protein
MKKGMILYITQGKEDVPLQAAADLIRKARSLGVTAVCVAITEEDAVHGWWSLLTRGMQQVLFMTADYNGVLDKFESQGAPVRLCG